MTSKPKDFAVLVDRDYGPEIAQKFRDKFPDQLDSEISFEHLMDELDKIFGGPRGPLPKSRPTNSRPGPVFLRMID